MKKEKPISKGKYVKIAKLAKSHIETKRNEVKWASVMLVIAAIVTFLGFGVSLGAGSPNIFYLVLAIGSAVLFGYYCVEYAKLDK